MICSKCGHYYENSKEGLCPHCGKFNFGGNN